MTPFPLYKIHIVYDFINQHVWKTLNDKFGLGGHFKSI